MPAPDTRRWLVAKFGGTSVATGDRWRRIADRAREALPRQRVWIVVSALAGVSDALERAIGEAGSGEVGATVASIRRQHRKLAEELGIEADRLQPVEALWEQLDAWLTGIRLTGEATPRLAAQILSLGELASTRLGIEALASLGVTATWVDARTLLTAETARSTDEHRSYLEAQVLPVRDPDRADKVAGPAEVVLTQGFIANTTEGRTCLLGRGGSDTSAALFAVLLDARELEIWTDVHGLFTADPRVVPVARVIRRIGYREAQELASMGAKVLHPRCLRPVREAGIPVRVRSVLAPAEPGTRIEATDEEHPVVTAVTCRQGTTLLSLATGEMWEESGFLARIFAPFQELGISVDLLATSQSAVTLTLDRIPGGTEGSAFARLIERLQQVARVAVVHPCGVVSIVGRRIRAALPEIGQALSAFRERPVHLVSASAEDLNVSFVVEEQAAEPLVVKLHEQLFQIQGEEGRLGPTWEITSHAAKATEPADAWWRARREELIATVRDGRPRYVYHLPTVASRVSRLRAELPSPGRLYYSMKANPHEELLRTVVAGGLGVECVSAAEVLRAREVAGETTPILFTPNFCPLDEYETALGAGAELVVDGPEPLRLAPETFRGVALGLRVDPGQGRGHHEKVRTAGPQVKFGCPSDEIEQLLAAVDSVGARVVGLHAHVGSGILDPEVWARTGAELAELLSVCNEVDWIDLGGGLGIPERPGQLPLDLRAVERGLAELKRRIGEVELRLEPGRFLVAEAGVLVSPVTQVRDKGGVRFVGLAAGMNALIRPALYGAWHGIHNLSRLGEPPSGYSHVVGPICESGDILGRDRLLPETHPGDVLLIENVGAYGAVMASSYNLRERPREIVLR